MPRRSVCAGTAVRGADRNNHKPTPVRVRGDSGESGEQGAAREAAGPCARGQRSRSRPFREAGKRRSVCAGTAVFWIEEAHRCSPPVRVRGDSGLDKSSRADLTDAGPCARGQRVRRAVSVWGDVRRSVCAGTAVQLLPRVMMRCAPVRVRGDSGSCIHTLPIANSAGPCARGQRRVHLYRQRMENRRSVCAGTAVVPNPDNAALATPVRVRGDSGCRRRNRGLSVTAGPCARGQRYFSATAPLFVPRRSVCAGTAGVPRNLLSLSTSPVRVRGDSGIPGVLRPMLSDAGPCARGQRGTIL